MTALEQKEKELTALQTEIETLKGTPPPHVEPEVVDVEKDSDAS